MGVAGLLESLGESVLKKSARFLADLKVTLEPDRFLVEGRQVSGILFRATPDSRFSDSFSSEERPFVDAEIRAVWLAAMQIESILAINRHDAGSWFEGSGWSVWRRRLIEQGVPVSRFWFGDDGAGDDWQWHLHSLPSVRPAPGRKTRRALAAPVTGSVAHQTTLLVDDLLLPGSPQPASAKTADLLRSWGIRLAGIVSDDEGKVLSVDTLPHPQMPDIEHVVCILAEKFRAHLRTG
jgi:hypothetical protein